MNVLYILGNGFDKAQGMNTSYPEFYQYLMKTNGSPLLEQMKKEIDADKKFWSDMEEALGVFTSKVKTEEDMDSFHDELSQHLQKYLKKEDANFVPSAEKRNKIKWDLLQPEKYLAEADAETYNHFVKSISNKSIGVDYHVMTFNYTNTFEKILSVSGPNPNISLVERQTAILRDICHVHGQLNDTIIIGVDNKDQIENVGFRSSEIVNSFLIKSEANNAMKNLRHKKCEQLIKQANLIFLFGVSYGETDSRWWKLIGGELKNRKDLCVISFLYCPNDVPATRRFRLADVEKRERERLYAKMNIDFIDDINSRFFIEINSNIFSGK